MEGKKGIEFLCGEKEEERERERVCPILFNLKKFNYLIITHCL